jgi:pantothenate kinase
MGSSQHKTEIDVTQFKGTSDQIAEQVFKTVLLPMLQQIQAQNTEEAKVFAFSIMWLGMSQYAQFFPTSGAKKSIEFATNKLIEVLKKQRGELKI